MPGKALSDNFEGFLAKYAEKASQIFYGVTYCHSRQLAYRLRIANNVPMSQSWISNNCWKGLAEEFYEETNRFIFENSQSETYL